MTIIAGHARAGSPADGRLLTTPCMALYMISTPRGLDTVRPRSSMPVSQGPSLPTVNLHRCGPGGSFGGPGKHAFLLTAGSDNTF